eukprot:5549226-Pyramimonas_sp.AAC.1
MPRAKRPCLSSRAISRAISASHLFEDVSSERLVLTLKRSKRIVDSRDVGGETAEKGEAAERIDDQPVVPR